MRIHLRNFFLDTLGKIVKPKPGIHIINAHYCTGDNDVGDNTNFIKQLEHITRYGKLIRFEEAINLIENKQTVSEPLIAFSFDDGFLDCYNLIAPVLESYGLNAAFFINPNLIECDDTYYTNFSKRVTVNGKKIMNWAQIIDLKKRGHIIGAHTMDHMNLGIDTTIGELEYQLGSCKKIIDEKLQMSCNTFAYPYGGFNNLSSDALEVAQKHYKYIFSGTNYSSYYSFNNQVINRRHIEPFWPISHLNYFLSVKKKYD